MSTTTIPKASGTKSSRPATPSFPVAQLQNTEQSPPPKSPYHWIPCFKFLISLFIAFCLPLILYLILRKTNGGAGVPAPHWLAAYSEQYPRVASQFLTYIADFFTYIVQWALSGAVGVLSCGYFLTPRPIHYLDIFSALKAGGTTQGWGPPYGPLLATGLFSVLYTLTMTSGFIGLISPFPLAIPSDISVGRELNLSSFEPSCYTWYNDTSTRIFGADGALCNETVVYGNTNFTYTACPLQGQFNEVLDSARTNMVSRFASDVPLERRSNLASAFPQLANTRITGGTAGTLPTGPVGVYPFTNATFPNITAVATSFNYTLILDGVWAEVSCSYASRASFPITMYPAVNGSISYDLQCPGKQLLLQPVNAVDTDNINNNLLLAGACVNSAEYIVYLRSFWSYDDYVQQISNRTTLTFPPYAGIDAMKCRFAPRIGTVIATYQTDLAAFNMTPSSDPYILFNETSDMTYLIVRRAMVNTLFAISDAQTPWNGNLIAGLVRTVARTYGGLNGQEKHSTVLGLVGDALKGIFEYEVTHNRLVLTAESESPAPDECYRNVNGSLVEQVIGWNAQLSVTLGLLPLMILSFMGMVMILWGILLGGSATDFDPTDHVALIVAAGNANLRIAYEDKVEHLNEDIVQKSTMVSYTKNVTDSNVQWGLQLHRPDNQPL